MNSTPPRPFAEKPRFKPSVTVAAVIEHNGKFLLVEEHTPEGLRINNPAGHLEQGETPLQAVCREALEETACVFTPQALLGVYLSRFVRPAREGAAEEDITYLRLAYRGTVGDALLGQALDDGIVRKLWLTPAEIQAQSARHRSPLVWRCISDHLAGNAYPLNVVVGDASLHVPWVMLER